MCVETFGFATWLRRSHCNGCMLHGNCVGEIVLWHLWLFMCAWCCSLVESVVGMAACLLPCSVAMCVDRCGIATLQRRSRSNGWAVRVLPWSFAAGHCKLHWVGCMEGALVICQHIFLNFGADHFPSRIPFKRCFKMFLGGVLAQRSGLGSAISVAIARNSMVLCNSVSADGLAMAASRFLGVAGACVSIMLCSWAS